MPDIPQLCLATLPAVPAAVARPAYDPRAIGVGIFHLGVGAFHRAHQAVYTDDVLARDPRWGICGISLKSARTIEPLAAQDGLYTLLTRTSDGVTARVVGSLREAMFAGAARAAAIARMADPRITVITSTVTEKGYCHDPATGALNDEHPDIAHDLAAPDAPESAIGIVVAGFAARRAANAGGITFVCCDNLPHNGRMVEGLVHAFAQRRDAALARWIADHVTFPSAMVDRIVPATTPEDLVFAQHVLGLHDAAVVAAEPFGQWVIENRFGAARPAWEEAGAQLVADVAPFELMKLRLLNGSHSTLAYLGFLLGHEFVWQAVRDPLIATLIERQMHDEIVPTLTRLPGVDLPAHCRKLLERFANPALPHRTQQIAMDGSQKLPQRLLGAVRERIAAGAPLAHLPLAVAGWIRYASGSDERGGRIDVQDPLVGAFRRIVDDAHGDPGAIADGFLDLPSVFGADLGAHDAFREAVRGYVVQLFRDGAQVTLAHHLGVA
ncbi:MAG: mannitol dehydrogenase family protein [Burkholderiales bacterium]|nr:mannitol dehydrogenase family protein [Burkholderiales bacterium]